MPSADDRRPNSSWVNFDQPFEGFTVDRSRLGLALSQSPASFWRPAARSRPPGRAPPRLELLGWVVRRLALGCALATLAFGLFIGLTVYRFGQVSRQVFRGGGSPAYVLQDELDPAQLDREGDSRVNLLLAGKGGPGHDGPNLTDSLIVVSLDPGGNSAALLSLPRDWQVELPTDPGNWVRINAVYALVWEREFHRTGDRQAAEAAGLRQLERVVEQNLDLTIHYHVLVDFDGFVGLVDAIGGVEVDIARRLYDVRAELDLQPGRQVLDGRQALAYARARWTIPGGDFGRSSHQRQLLLAVQDRTASLGVLTIAFKANQILAALGDSVVTNLSLDEAKRLYRAIQGIPAENLASFDLVSDPILLQPQDDDGQAVLWPTGGRDDYGPIQKFIRQQLPDWFIRREAAGVAVWRQGEPPPPELIDRLESYGYRIVAAQATEIDPGRPALVATTTEKPYTSSYLAKRFGARAATPEELGLDPGRFEADITLILPDDYEV